MAAWGLGVLLGCGHSDAFLCESDESCRRGGTSGLCQANGYCSFPDAACPSGQRYGEYVGDALAGTCVGLEPSSEEVGTSSDATSITPSTSNGPTTLTTSLPTTGLDGPVTTEPVDDTGMVTTSTSTGVVDDDPGTTSASMVTCWLDDFEDGMIDGAWCSSLDAGILADESRGHLRFLLEPAGWGMGGGGGGGNVSTCDPFPLLGADARVEVVEVPQVSPYTEAYIELGNEGLRLGLGVVDAQLYAFEWDGMQYAGVAWQPYMPMAQRWLRVSGTEEGLVAEHSPDGMAWVHVHTMAADLAGAEGSCSIGVWSEMVPLGPDHAEFESFELCTES
jgi:hypothetical protein